MSVTLKTMKEDVTRRTYLITYSQADLEIMPSKEVFAAAVVEAFRAGGGASQPVHWCCGVEVHEDGGFHYHLIVKLSAASRWFHVRTALKDVHNIDVHFSEGYGARYSDGYRYVCKEDANPHHSDPHPDLVKISAQPQV